ncbi:MAG: hypothetical protein ABJA87_03875 [bacterium]
MSDYIDFAATGRVLLYSLVAGLVIVGGFAFGARNLAEAEGARAAARPVVARFALAGLCFAVAAAGVVIGIWFTLEK